MTANERGANIATEASKYADEHSPLALHRVESYEIGDGRRLEMISLELTRAYLAGAIQGLDDARVTLRDKFSTP